MGFIGVGGMGTNNLQTFLRDERVQPVAVCDVEAAHRNRAIEFTKLSPDAGFNDFREVIARADIDAVMVATPDHWHAIITCAAARAGKDIYCEKPLSLTVREGRIVADTVAQHRRVVQVGTWRRSRAACRRACELVRNGRIGKLHTIRVGAADHFYLNAGMTGHEPAQPVPEGFDYPMWLGQCPDKAYTPARCHFNFRWITDYSAGHITDTGAHYLDIAQWGLGADGSGPSRIAATGRFATDKGIYDAPEQFEIEYTYGDVKVIFATVADQKQHGMRFEGSDGWVHVENSTIIAEPRQLAAEKIGEEEVHLYESADHHRNFIDCVISRGQTAAPVEVGHRSATACHLGYIALRTGRTIQWDPRAEQIIGDSGASELLARPMRAPWSL